MLDGSTFQNTTTSPNLILIFPLYFILHVYLYDALSGDYLHKLVQPLFDLTSSLSIWLAGSVRESHLLVRQIKEKVFVC